jgi:POT family proton-dependent oligopeptide transporter
MTTTAAPPASPSLLGHPTGLFTLFFAEMWERFSYYGMRALLIFYMIKGFLGYSDDRAYAVYGTYTALVYMTPYFGGLLADRLLGKRRAVIFGGLLMAAGHLVMTIEHASAFYGALALLIAGNGFFKPNISTIVGSLYSKDSEKKDGGFTIFYMGINLGAAMSPILCGYVGETYGWHYGFGLATIGMLIGVAVFVAPTRLTQAVILGGAVLTSLSMLRLQDSLLQLAVRIIIGLTLTGAGVIAFVALGRGGLPPEAGAPPDPAALKRKLGGFLPIQLAVFLGTAASVGVFMLVVQHHTVALYTLSATGLLALVYLLYEAFRSPLIERHRLFVVLILFFFSMLFWAFFEQAGSSINNFTDRNVDRAFQDRTVAAAEVGQDVRFRIPLRTDDPGLAALPVLSQEQLGHRNGDPAMNALLERVVRSEEALRGKLQPKAVDDLVRQVTTQPTLTMTALTTLRSAAGREGAPAELKTMSWRVVPENVGMGIASAEMPASEFQAANAVFILVFGLLFSALWTFLGSKGLEPSTPFKFSLGLLQLGLGFAVFWYGSQRADARGMTGISWLLLGYLLHTTGELCLSPVGLSMVTKLSPARIVSTVMGSWFLASAFSNYLAGVIAAFTGVSSSEGEQIIPAPIQTVHIYGGVFGKIAITAIVSAFICFALTPLLRKWMHPEVAEAEPAPARAPADKT